jgi:hypothetical protein
MRQAINNKENQREQRDKIGMAGWRWVAGLKG